MTNEAGALRLTGAQPLRPGDPDRVGPYATLALLGSGGMGRVYLGRAADDGPGLFAVKVIRPEYAEDPRFRRRFEREALVHDRIRTARAPRLRGTGFEAELLWMATEYLPSLDLADAVREDGALATSAVWRLVAELGEALGVLAEAHVVHRDLKPSNVLLSDRGTHVIDFGIAKAVDVSAITGTGNRVGTPAYMSPEYLRTGHCDTASDVFSLAGTLIYAAVGRAPFGDGTGVDVMHRVAFEEPDAEVLAKVTAADPALGALLASCLAKDPAERPTPAELTASAAPHVTSPDWPEPLGSRVRELRQAYDVLHDMPVALVPHLRPRGHRPPLGATPPPGPLSRPAPDAVVIPPVADSGVAQTPGSLAYGAAEPGESAGPASGREPDSRESNGSSGGSKPLLPGPGRRRRKRLIIATTGVSLCAVAAGTFVLTRPGTPASAAPPKNSVVTSGGTSPSAGASGSGEPSGTKTISGDRSASDPADPGGGPSVPTPDGAADEETVSAGPTPSAGPSGGVVDPGTTPGAESPSPDPEPQPAGCSYYAGNGPVGPGDSGKKVQQAQCLLVARGYNVGGENGSYGAGTEAAVRSFQDSAGLKATGSVDRSTWGALRSG
ncbi:serine/threonine-protein kinase [Streptomyces sp. ST1015]|uniref:serine/threonine-protein kinase n=1 Tax=unclassified Streptomyces TaxID=2593676 RepID=UPI001CA72907|nr:serine/threonine-protein kinase [Streptomyces sp. ST1015]QZZ26034.1 protein kinase [Streptomyces sp. ST1015]